MVKMNCDVYEKDTYLLLLAGFTMQETAEKLGLEYLMVETYQLAICKKLSVSSNAELIINYHDIDEGKGEV